MSRPPKDLPKLIHQSSSVNTDVSNFESNTLEPLFSQEQLLEDDDTWIPMSPNRYEFEEDNYRREIIRKAKSVRRFKLIVMLLSLPVMLLAGLVGLAFYSYAIMVTTSKRLVNVLIVSFSFLMYFGMMVGVLYLLTAAGESLQSDIEENSYLAIGIFFILMFIGSIAGIGRANANPQFLNVDYPSSRIRFNLDNSLALLSLVTEFLSLCAFVFQPSVPWTEKSGLNIGLRWFVIDFGADLNAFVVSFYVMLGTVCVFFIVVTIILALIKYVKFTLVEIGQYKVVNIGFPLLSETVFIPVVTVMMRAMTCSFQSEGPFAGQMTLDAMCNDPSLGTSNSGLTLLPGCIPCWTGVHKFYAGFSLIALMSYFPTALFMGTRLSAISDGAFAGEKLDIKYRPIFYMWATFTRCILAGVATFFTREKSLSPVLYSILSGNLILLLLNFYFKPCCVKVINKLRTFLYLSSLWSTISAIIAIEINERESWLSIIVWCSGLGVIVIALTLSLFLDKTVDSRVEVYAFGQGHHGELGLGATRNIHEPLRSGNLSEHTVVKVIVQGQSNFAITSRSRVFCWGSGLLMTVDPGEEGLLEPHEVPELTHKKISDIYLGSRMGLAVSQSGQVFYWTCLTQVSAQSHRTHLTVGGVPISHRHSPIITSTNPPIPSKPHNNSSYNSINGNKNKNTTNHNHDHHNQNHNNNNNNNNHNNNNNNHNHNNHNHKRDKSKVSNFGSSVSEVLLRNDIPVPVPGEVAGQMVVKVVVTDIDSVFMITTEGQVFVFGDNRNNLFGPGAPEVVVSSIRLESLDGIFVSDLWATKDRVFVISSSGDLYTWGLGSYGILGHGHCTSLLEPTLVRFFSENNLVVTQATCNDYYACALVNDGRLFMWGRYDPIDGTRNDFLSTRPLPAKVEETVDVWPMEVVAMRGIAVTRIHGGCPECLIVTTEDGGSFRIVYKTIVADPAKAVHLWETAEELGLKSAKIAHAKTATSKRIKSGLVSALQAFRKANAARFRGVVFTAEPYLVARRLVGGAKVMAVETTPDFAAIAFSRFDYRVQVHRTYVRVVFFKKAPLDFAKLDVLTYDEPLVAGKDYHVPASHVQSIRAGRDHVVCVALH